MKPSIGDTVHYVARGSADGRFPPACRAAIVTEVEDGVPFIGLVALNPTGLFFHPMEMGGCKYHDGAETPGDPNCTLKAQHGNPMRYCPCGWIEASQVGGTWHWPETDQQ